MKKVKYLAMLLAAGMFAACSDNLEDTGAGNAGGTTPCYRRRLCESGD